MSKLGNQSTERQAENQALHTLVRLALGLGADSAGVFVKDPHHGHWQLAAWAGPPLVGGADTAALVGAAQKPWFSDPGHVPAQAGIPLAGPGEAAGALIMQRYGPVPFDASTVVLLSALARPIVPGEEELPVEAVLGDVEHGVILVDGRGRLRRLSPAMCRLIHGTLDSPAGLCAVKDVLKARFLHPGVLVQELDFLAAPSCESRSVEVVSLDPPGVFRIYTGPLLDVAGQLAGRAQVYQDITSQRENQMAVVIQAGMEIAREPGLASVLSRLAGVLDSQVSVDWMCLVVASEGVWETCATWARPGLGKVHWPGPGEADIGSTETTVVTGLACGELAKAGLAALARVPLWHKDGIAGYWYLGSWDRLAFEGNQAHILEPIAGLLAGAVHASLVYREADGMYHATIQALAATVDARDRYTMNHSANVSRYAGVMARAMGLPPKEVQKIEHAGLVHDIGKVGIPDRILNKPGRLDPAERAVMITHSAAGAAILERAGSLRELAPLVRHHHEWHGGGGYPSGLAGDDIPIGAAIVAVADAFDTMTSYRVYRPALSLDRAMAELRRCTGEQFHPLVVEALSQGIQEAQERREPWVAELEFRTELPAWVQSSSHTLVEQGLPAITPKELTVLLRIGEELMRLLDLSQLLTHVLDIIRDEMGYYDVGILLLDQHARDMVVAASGGTFTEYAGVRLPEGTGIAWWVMEHGLAQNVPDVTRDPRFYQPEGTWARGSEVYVPLESRGHRLGVLVAARKEINAFRQSDIRMLTAVAAHMAGAIQVAQLHEQVKLSAATDPLTGLYNRRYFMQRLEEELARARRHGRVLAVAILDLDHLKWVNDNFGHLVGDEVLTQLADHLRVATRLADTVARFAGDEFVILMPETDQEGGQTCLARLAQAWAGKWVNAGKEGLVPVPGITHGVASYPVDGDSPREIIARADERLLQAKHRGRAQLASAALPKKRTSGSNHE